MIRNIVLDIIFTIITFGLFNIYIQYCQIIAINDMLKEEVFFLKWLIFWLITCGYTIFMWYVKGNEV